MRIARNLSLLTGLLSLCWSGITRAEEREPSIEEMWAAVEAHLASKSPAETGDPGGAVLEERAGAAKGKKTAVRRRSIDFRRLLKRLKVRALELFEVHRRGGYEFETAMTHVRLEAFDEAARILERMLKRRSSISWHGLVEAEYACAMAHLGRQHVAYQYIPLSEKALERALLIDDEDVRPGPGAVRTLKGKLEFAKNYAEACERLAELTASLSKERDPDKQWEMVNSLDAEQGGVRLGVRWLVELHKMRMLYPEHEVNRGEGSDRMLARAYRHHCMYEECIGHVTQVLEDKPKTLPYIKNGYAHWDRAYSQELLAGLHRRMRHGQRALAGFEKALEYFQEFQRELPDCSFTRRGEERESSYVDIRIRRLREEIENLGGRP